MANLARVPKIVPWTSTEEYIVVAECLYSPDIDERRRGVSIVKAWRARARLPVAIDATANLVEMSITEEKRGKETTTNQLQHLYGMALIRFVNSIIDLEQKGVYAQSVVTLAARIGMPAWFVELRHAATHEHFPSLQVLRLACGQALAWLKSYYWNKQDRKIPEETRPHIRNELLAYLSAQDMLIQARAEQVHADQMLAEQMRAEQLEGRRMGRRQQLSAVKAAEQGVERASERLGQFIGGLHPDVLRPHLIPVLLEPGFLVPEEKKYRSKFPDCRISSVSETRWVEVLVWFAGLWGESLFIEDLLSAIVDQLTPDASALGIFELGETSLSTSQAATLVAWIRWILENYYVPNAEEPRAAINIDDLLESCLRNPSYYSRAILRLVSELDPALKKDLKPFVDYMGKSLVALAALETETKGAADKAKHPAIMSEKAMQKEEALMRERLEKTYLSTKPVEQPLCESGSTPIAADAATDTDAAAAAAAANASKDTFEDQLPSEDGMRWSYAPKSSWTACAIGTLAEDTIPPLEWPAWLDELPVQIVPE
ncbi:rRNA-processing protein las1 [Coemansia sp. Benny D115]|nr:rRNA-processing protein las1 [Coemansia sp. Benny D115]